MRAVTPVGNIDFRTHQYTIARNEFPDLAVDRPPLHRGDRDLLRPLGRPGLRRRRAADAQRHPRLPARRRAARRPAVGAAAAVGVGAFGGQPVACGAEEHVDARTRPARPAAAGQRRQRPCLRVQPAAREDRAGHAGLGLLRAADGPVVSRPALEESPMTGAFSVATAVRDGMPLIRACVASVAAQPAVREHPIQDACSGDGTRLSGARARAASRWSASATPACTTRSTAPGRAPATAPTCRG
ncbi:MAG: hypothetical protein MZW92_47570 [Comamonadaceae bacterium]|nr:hypothetical protein [Comamonadaceae bacterium]